MLRYVLWYLKRKDGCREQSRLPWSRCSHIFRILLHWFSIFAFAMQDTNGDTPSEENLVVQCTHGGLSLLWRETGARQPFSTLRGRSLVTYFQEHPEADCFIYQLVLRSTKDTPPSLFILIYGQPAHVESERTIVLWHELLGKRTQPAAPGSETAFRKSTRLPRYNTTSY